jgi:hypothetical protein
VVLRRALARARARRGPAAGLEIVDDRTQDALEGIGNEERCSKDLTV